MTDPSDAAITTAILATIDDAAAKHPRGMLHVAALSKEGWNLVVKLLKQAGKKR